MNATEREYAAHLEQRRMRGEIAKWRHEAWTVKLAHDVRLTVDFYVLRTDGTIEWHDAKGTKHVRRKSGATEQVPYVTEDARIKLAMAAREYPEFRWLEVYRRGSKEAPIWSAVEVPST